MLGSLFFPRLCPMCESYVGEKAVPGRLCDKCRSELPRTEQAELRQNETEMALTGKKKGNIVAAMKSMHLDRAAAFLFYEKDDPIQDVIHLMKYKDRPEIGYELGKEAAMEMQYADFFDSIDVIVPMPLHPRRLNERGYNQSEYIAKGISAVTGIPVDTTHVTRIRNTPQQALQRGEERKTNVEDAFAVNHPEQMYHKHILVVDDLITTGETVRSCLKAMKRFRGAQFSVFALCKAR
jgi:ComF family protein